ncbi:flagellar hook-length control protein FliK [Pantoea sp. Tr-811]|uniref:flagellar hook-length control protein FliK n=1 Tax=Pantoea sp. Tr-811 TaxID=2608361 RepID=UPI001422D211|nr:flagellar hook-length control protein FliK [Pantoea sp. Tr-811]
MDIITALAPAAPATPQVAADDSVATGQATPFDALLQQVQGAEPVAASEPAVAAVPAPMPSEPPLAAPAPALPPQAPELPEAGLQVASDPVQPEPEPQPLPALPIPAEAAEVAPAEADEPPPVVAVVQQAAEGEGDALAMDDDPEPASDSLEAIRQRLELIDSAGLMASGALAVAPPVTWAQPTVAAPEPETERGTGDALEPAVDLGLVVDNPAETAAVAELAVEGSDSQKADGAFTLGADWDLSALPGAPALALHDAGSEAAPVLIGASVGSDEWQADLGQQVVAMVRRGERQVDVQLHPADLGPLSISLNVSDSGVQAQFQSAHASVRAAVEQALPQLQSALASQGLALGEASVNDGASRQAMGEQAPRREAREPRVVQAEKPAPALPTANPGSGVDLYL